MLLHVVWDIKPYFEIGSLNIRYYSLCFAIAFLLGHEVLKRLFKHDGVSEKMTETVVTYSIIATLIGARLGHVIFYDWAYYQNHLAEIFLPVQFSPNFEFIGFRGLASHGAAIALIIMMFYLAKNKFKQSFLWLGDRLIIPICLGASLVRLGNFFNSEIIGIPVSNTYPFGVIFSRLGEHFPRHPAQLYEALVYFISFIILYLVYYRTDKKQSSGFIFGLALVLIWGARFCIEFIKEAQIEDRASWTLNTGQILSIPFVLVGLVLVFRPLRFSRK